MESLPNQAFFDACVGGNEEYVRSYLPRKSEFDLNKLFKPREMRENREDNEDEEQGEEDEV